MKHRFPSIVGATAAVVAFAFQPAHGDVLIRESFPSADYITGSLANKGSSATGFDATNKWNQGTSGKIFVLGSGLEVPSDWDAAYESGGYAIGYSDSSFSTDASTTGHYRGSRRELAADAIPAEGTFYYRALLRQGSGAGAATRVEGMLRGVGFRSTNFTTSYARDEAGSLLNEGVWFAFRKTAGGAVADTELVLRLGPESQTLVATVAEDTTYLCVAKITVGSSGATAQAFALPIGSYAGTATFGSDIATDTITSETPLRYLCVTGPYMTNSKAVSFDEIFVGETLADVIPVDSAQLTVYPTAEPTSTLRGFSVPYSIVLPEGATGTPTVELLWAANEQALESDPESTIVSDGLATVSVLDPDTSYAWKLRATLGNISGESPIQSIKTLGAPVFDLASAVVVGPGDEGRAAVAYSATLSQPGWGGERNTVIYETHATQADFGTAYVNEIGRTDEAGVEVARTSMNYPWGQTYYWFITARVYADDGETILSETVSATNSFKVLVPSGTLYVAVGGTGAAPYDSPENAAPSISDAVSVAGNESRILVAPGVYPVSSRIALDRAIRIEGTGAKPDAVVITNTVDGVNIGAGSRVFNLTNGVTVANLTITGGRVRNNTGGNVFMRGGMLTNCVIAGGSVIRDNTSSMAQCTGGGVYIQGGTITHCVFRGNRAEGSSDGYPSGDVRAAALHASIGTTSNPILVSNCLFEDNGGEGAHCIAKFDQYGRFINSTIVKSSLGVARAAFWLWASSSYAKNIAVAGVDDGAGGTVPPVVGYVQNASFCAFDIDSADAPENLGTDCVFSTPNAMFENWTSGNYKPEKPLRDKGGEISGGYPEFDLSGKSQRLVGKTIDIGCYEWQGAGPTIISLH